MPEIPDNVTEMNELYHGEMAILGVVRNGGEGFAPTLGGIGKLAERLERARVCIATNDNEDSTDEILSKWSQGKSYVETIRLDGLAASMTLRTDRIALARCFLLERLFSTPNPPEFTLILDLDGPNSELPVETILKIASQKDGHWDAVFANQRTAYYDLWALRHPDWCPEDCWEEVQKARKGLIQRKRLGKVKNDVVHARQFHIAADLDWIEVDSAFGGLGLYRTESLRGHWYSPRDERSKTVCEHVVLHQSMKDAGARLFIAPELLNETPNEHLGPSSGLPFPDSYKVIER